MKTLILWLLLITSAHVTFQLPPGQSAMSQWSDPWLRRSVPLWAHPSTGRNKFYQPDATDFLSAILNQYQGDGKVDDRSFGLKVLGLGVLANYAINSSPWTTTITSYATTVSTINVGTTAICYTRTMFQFVTPCRKKRAALPTAGLVIGDDRPISPSIVQPIEASTAVMNDKEPMVDVHSSKSRSDRQIAGDYYEPNFYLGGETFEDPNFGEVVYVVTSTIPNYVFYTSTVTSTNTNLALANGLRCLPNGYTLC